MATLPPTTADTIAGYYTSILARPTGSINSTSPEVLAWAAVVTSGALTLAQVEAAITASPEAQDTVVPIVEIYQTELGRAPDAAGLAAWVGLEHSGVSLSDIAADIANSAEGKAFYGNSGSTITEPFLTALYQTALGRTPDTGGFNAWMGSGLTQAQLEYDFATSAEAMARAAPAVSTFFASIGDGDTTAYGSSLYRGGTGSTFTLTPGVDGPDNAVGTNIVGSLSTFFFDGVGPTLNTGDAITGSGADNSLTLADGFGSGTDIIPAGITVTNIQNVVLDTAGNAGNGGQPFDTSPYSSVTSTTVSSSGAGIDTVQAAGTSDITVNHNSTAGGVQTFGGSATTVNTNGNLGVTVGGNGVNQLPGGTGAITVNANGTGGGAGAVTVLGGADVNITVATATATGNITVGNTGLRALTEADNPSGAIDIVSNSLAGAGNVETILGGTTVTVVAKGDTINIGDATATTASNQPSSTVTVTDLLPIAYDDLTGPGTTHNATKGGAIAVNGGTDVSVTTNTGGGVAVGTAGKAGTYATGAVTVTDTSSDQKGAFGIGVAPPTTTVVGGTDVTVTEAGGAATIGSATAADDPSGAISVTETAASHTAIRIDGGSGVTVAAQGQGVTVGFLSGTSGAQSITQASVYSGKALGSTNATSAVTDDGGTTVTVNTTGGDVVVGSGAHAPTGAVAITNTFSGAGTANGSAVSVLGGAAVAITETNTTNGAIAVGAVPALNSVGTGVKNLASDPTGNVTINNSVTNGTTTTYGTSATTVYTNGATVVSVTGAGATTIADANDLTPTSGTVGTSTLATVNLDGVNGAVAISSGALTALTIADSVKATTTTPGIATAVTVSPVGNFSAEGAHALALTLSNDTNTGTSVTDPTATALTIGTTGTAADNIGINAAKATSLTFNNAAALTVAAGAILATSGTDTITATGSGALTLGNTTLWTGAGNLASINASTASGAVSARINGNVTAFTGGSGDDVVTVDTGAAKAINGGTGSNTVILTAAASAYNSALSPTAPVFADFSNFQTLGLATGATGTYDVSGFSGVTISGTTGAVTTINAAAGETLTFTGAPIGITTWGLKTNTGTDALSVTVGVDGTATTTTAGIAAGNLTTTSMETVTVNSVGASTTLASPTTDLNTITLTDAGTKTLNVTGHANVAVTDTTGTLTTINVTSTAAADVSGVVAAAAGITITGGAGLLTASTDTPNTAGTSVDSVTTGSGGGVITLGLGGSGGVAASAAGSENVNLAASNTSGVSSTIIAADTGVALGTRGIIAGFNDSANAKAADVLQLATSHTIVANAATVTGLSGSTYSVSNGIYTLLSASGSLISVPATQTLKELQDVQKLVETNGAASFGAVTINSTTYVIASNTSGNVNDAVNEIAGNLGTATFDTNTDAGDDTIFQLTGLSGVTGFGQAVSSAGGVSTAAANTIELAATTGSIVLGNAGHTGSSVAGSTNTFIDTGFATDSLSVASTTGVTNNYTNLGASATLFIGGSATGGAVSTTQVGASGTNSLVIAGTGVASLSSFTANGDNALVLDSTTSGFTLAALIDGTNTVTTVSVVGGSAGSDNIAVGTISDTALTTVDASKMAANLTLSGVSQNNLVVKGPSASAGGSLTLTASGSADVITGSAIGANIITANGAGDTITGGTSTNTITANGAGDTITVGSSTAIIPTAVAAPQIIHASGAGDTITFASTTTPTTSGATGAAITYTGGSTINGGLASIGIGNNSTVNFGTNTGVGTANVVLTGDVTGATSSGAFAFITLNNLGVGDSMTFGNATTGELTAGASFGASQVNVASATTLAGALDLAAASDAMSQQSGTTAAGLIAANTGVLDWFQFAGNTYITEAVNSTSTAATHTALGASDAVVKIGGLVDLSSSTFATGAVTYHTVAA
jgi:Domain of unknown function (DUF4214)